MLVNKEAFFHLHENKLTNLFQVALTQLAKNDNLSHEENDLNKELYLVLRTKNFELNKLGDGLDRLPLYELPKQPVNKEDLTSEDSDVRPDFTYKLSNKYKTSPEDQELDYHIECKRLGDSSLSREYIDNGIKRFGSRSHSYGEGVNYGIMIGYIQTGNHKTVQIGINGRLENLSFACEEIQDSITAENANKLSEATQKIDRTEVLPGNFKIKHMWLDIRKK